MWKTKVLMFHKRQFQVGDIVEANYKYKGIIFSIENDRVTIGRDVIPYRNLWALEHKSIKDFAPRGDFE